MLVLNFSPFPELVTERLILRELKLADAEEIFFLRSDHDVLRYLGREPATDIKEAKKFIRSVSLNTRKNESILWAITLKDDPKKTIGYLCFWRIDKPHYRAEIGYALNPAYWQKGIIKEAILGALDYGFTKMGLHSVEGRTSPDNLASIATLESTGFVKEAHFKESFYFREKFEDTVVYSRLK